MVSEEMMEDDSKIGSVKAAITCYRERIQEADATPQNVYVQRRQLHQAKRTTHQFNESKLLAQSATDKAKYELSTARKTVKDLTARIEESNLRAKRDLVRRCDNQVMRELEMVKHELSRLNLDMASILEDKKRADKQTEHSLSMLQSCMTKVEAFDKEIEEINEEHVLVELARIEAIKEYEQVEAHRREEAEKYTKATQAAMKKKQNIIRELEDAKDLETKLAITISDVDVLASELKQVKEMEKGIQGNHTLRSRVEASFDELGPDPLLVSVTKELEAAQMELAILQDESFRSMTSMDIIRDERKHVEEEITKLRNRENKSETKIENLNSKLLRAKAKLEATSAAEEKARSIASNLSLTFEQLKEEAEAAKKELSMVSEETALVKAEIQRAEAEKGLAEERFQVVLKELKQAKLSEATSLENLKVLAENTMRKRVSPQEGSLITISRFEYEYLAGQAAGAQEIADKKVSAAKAWIEALQASEKEIQIKSELLKRETRELKVDEEYEVNKIKGQTDTNISVEDDFENWRHSMETERMKRGIALPSKAMNRSVKKTPARRGKTRIFESPLARGTPRSTSFAVRRRRKVIPNIAKFFGRKSNGRINYLYEKQKT